MSRIDEPRALTTLLDLVRSRLGGGVLDAALHELVAGVQTELTVLTAAEQPAGRAKAEVAWRAVRSLVPLRTAAEPPFVDDVDIDVRALGRDGWEIGIALPAIEMTAPELEAGELRAPPAGRLTVVKTGGAVTLHIDALRAVVRAPHGSDVSVALTEVVATLEPDVLSLPAGFGLRVGEVRLGAEGTSLPDLEMFLPSLPGMPTGPVPVPGKLLADGGFFARGGPLQLPASSGAQAATISVVIDRPGARSLVDIVPTLVMVDFPLAGVAVPVPGGKPVTGAATGGGPLVLQTTISLEGTTATLRSALTGAGSARGIAHLGSSPGGVAASALAVVGALGPYIVDEDESGAGFVALMAAAAALGSVIGAATEVELLVHSVEVRALWSGDAPVGSGLDIRLDYEVQLPFHVSAHGLTVGTKPDYPYRVRHRDVRLILGAIPQLSWRGATSTVVSAGEWHVEGVPPELLRIADVAVRKGSLEIELDLRLALELGPVTLERAVLIVSLGGDGPPFRVPRFGISIDVPGAIAGRGELGFRNDRVDAALDVRLPSIGAGGRGALAATKDPSPADGGLMMLAAEVDLFSPIPFANSGLGLYSVGGVMAYNATPRLVGTDPITSALNWDPFAPDAWDNGRNVWMGFAASIGTVPDFGFSLMGRTTILVGVPDPALRASVEAKLLGGVAGSLTGVLMVDLTQAPGQLLIALQGKYEIPSLLRLTAPAGAIFPLGDLSGWSARVGGDRGPERGEPVTAHVLPGLLDLEAWMFLMAFGDASTIAGAALSGGKGLQLNGLSLAFGAGFDVEWSTGPFSFSAGGFILAALTRRPAPPGVNTPWVFAGGAELHGSVDLGPVSIGASAQLDAFVDPSAHIVFGDAHACASVDLWFTEIKGCVHLEIGAKPKVAAPKPESPLKQLALTDRVGRVVATASNLMSAAPQVWPDTIPVLVFDTWVGAPTPLPGLGTVIGDNSPAGDGWIGTAELAYRFDLVHVQVFEEGNTRSEIGSDWSAAWQLPLTEDVFGTGEPPARARSLALNVLDLHHWLQPAITLPENAPGDPIGILGRLCNDVPQPLQTWFPGQGATLPPAGPTQLHVENVAGQPAQSGDPTTVTVFVEDIEGQSLCLADALAPLWAQVAGQTYRPAGLEQLREPIDVDGESVTAVCWLPMQQISDAGIALVLRFDQPARDVVVYTVRPPERPAAEIGGADWEHEQRGDIGPWVLDAFRSPRGVPLTDIRVRPHGDEQIGILAISAVSERAALRREATESSRRTTHDALEGAAKSDKTPRRLMRRGKPHRIEVTLHWESRGTMYAHAFGDVTTPFWFSTATGGERRNPRAPRAGPLQPTKLFAHSAFAAQLYGESLLADADLARYVGGFVPQAGAAHWFLKDPVQALFVVDHLTELAEAYDSVLTFTARRTDAAPGTPPADLSPRVTPIPIPTATVPGLMVSPLSTDALTFLDQKRFAFAQSQEDRPDGCRVRPPGAAAKVPIDLEPDAAYRVSLTVDRAAGVLGEGALIAESRFTTSRYADVASMFLELGFVTSPGPTALVAFPLPPARDPVEAGVDFETILDSLGLDGYRSGARAGSAALWQQQGEQWLFTGVLLECPEPIERPGRVHVHRVLINDQEVPVRWDARATRVLALVPPALLPEPIVVCIDVTDSPLGGPVVRGDFLATVAPYATGITP